MFTKIGEYLKPLLGRRDHIPLSKVSSINHDNHSKVKKPKEKKDKKKRQLRNDDTTDLSLDAIEAMLKEVIIDNIDLYTDVKYIISELRKKKVEYIKIRPDESPLTALMRVANNLSIETKL